MIVRCLQGLASDKWTMIPGKTYDLPEPMARGLIAKGIVAVEPEGDRGVELMPWNVENATKPAAAETATQPKRTSKATKTNGGKSAK